MAYLSSQVWGAKERVHPGAKSVSSRFNERHYLKKLRFGTSGIHIHTPPPKRKGGVREKEQHILR